MQNKVTLNIAGQNYTLVAGEDAVYMEQVGKHVDTKVREIISDTKASLLDGALLGALNIADEYFKSMNTNEELRGQLKDQLEENTKLKMEIAELTRKNFELKNKR